MQFKWDYFNQICKNVVIMIIQAQLKLILHLFCILEDERANLL